MNASLYIGTSESEKEAKVYRDSMFKSPKKKPNSSDWVENISNEILKKATRPANVCGLSVQNG